MKTVEITDQWKRSIERALRDSRKPTRCVDGRYRVPSKSRPGRFQYVTLETGHIVGCTCEWWQRHGRRSPCGHAGAVALARLWEQGYSISVKNEPAPVASGYRGRSQMFREETAA